MATQIEKGRLRKEIDRFYDFGASKTPSGLLINDKVAEVFMKMLEQAGQCNKVSHFVPSPTYSATTVITIAIGYAMKVYDAVGPSGVRRYCATGALHHWGGELRRAGAYGQ